MLSLDFVLTEKGEPLSYLEEHRSTKKVKIQLEESHSLIPGDDIMMEEVMAVE